MNDALHQTTDVDMAWALTAIADYRLDLASRSASSAEYDLVKRFVLQARSDDRPAA